MRVERHEQLICYHDNYQFSSATLETTQLPAKAVIFLKTVFVKSAVYKRRPFKLFSQNSGSRLKSQHPATYLD